MKTYLFSLLLCGVILCTSSCGGEKDPAPLDCNASDLTLVLQSVEAATGCTSPDGSIVVDASGGVSPYQFQLNSGDFKTEGDFPDLTPGSYTLTVKDDAGCTTSENITIEGSNFSITVEKISDAGCKNAHGSFSVHSDSDNIQYKIADGSYQSSNIFSNLATGSYSIMAKDETGCETTASFKVLNGTSYKDEIKPIIQVNCVDPGCHNGSTPQPDWSVFANVKANAANIKTRTQNGSMPKTGSLTQEEKDLIACWVDDGALNN